MNKTTLKSGFGLLEVLFSTAVFIVVVGSLASLNQLSLRNAALSAHRTQAVYLAQDGLEAVRQMRDTGWIAKRAADSADDWLSYYISPTQNPIDQNCNGALGKPAINTDYEICYNVANSRWGLRVATPAYNATEKNTGYIVLKDNTQKADPSSPQYYRRIILFEAITSTNTGCGGPYVGLQILLPDTTGNICPVANYETFSGQPLHAVKVTSKVTWREFDKEWSISLETILTNWRSR